MKRASPYENDLFFSYAHIDNEPLIEGQQGWVSTLHRTLEVRVSQLLGVRPKVWWDRSNLRGNDAFAEEIAVNLGQVALLICVVSPAFLESDWCGMELAAFHKACEASGGVRLGRQSRVFKVVKTPVPREDPAQLRELLGYELYRRDQETGSVRELRPESPEDRRAYLDKLDDLAQDVCALLQRLREGEPAGTAKPEPEKRATIYVAQTTSDVRVERDRLLRSLRQREHGLLPAAPLPTHGPELREQVLRDLARCRLSVHLLGSHYGGWRRCVRATTPSATWPELSPRGTSSAPKKNRTP